MPRKRRACRTVRAGPLLIGGEAPISVQSMCKVDPHDLDALTAQVGELAAAGCDLVRVAVTDRASVEVFSRLKAQFPEVPLVADVHFDAELAIAAVLAGADKVRINPGNLGGIDKAIRVAMAARDRGASLRIGVNSGSLEKDILKRHGAPTAEALVESALRSIEALEDAGFTAFVVSLKSSSVLTVIEAYRLIAGKCACPLHLGVTEAGSMRSGIAKSAVAMGVLLEEGIGDTIRVSLTAHPLQEVRAARTILESLGLKKPGAQVISCPTCGRTHSDLASLVDEAEKLLQDVDVPLTVAIMGCEVNGPGEAKQADVGIAMGRERAVIFRNGRVVKTSTPSAALDELMREINSLLNAGPEVQARCKDVP